MIASSITDHAVLQVGPAPPVPTPQAVEPRAVENTARGSLDTEEYDTDTQSRPHAVLQLIRSSAECLSKLLKETSDPAAAETMTGSDTAAAEPAHVDVLA